MKSIERDVHTIDAEGQTPGRLASSVVRLLIGKHKPNYEPNVDAGDHVQLINASKIRLTGKKVDQKIYIRHTTYASGVRTVGLKHILSTQPSQVVRRAVLRMLPKNKLRKERLKRLVIKE